MTHYILPSDAQTNAEETAYLAALHQAKEAVRQRAVDSENQRLQRTDNRNMITSGVLAAVLLGAAALFSNPLLRVMLLVLGLTGAGFGGWTWQTRDKRQKRYAPKPVVVAKAYWRLLLLRDQAQHCYLVDSLIADPLAIKTAAINVAALQQVRLPNGHKPATGDKQINGQFAGLKSRLAYLRQVRQLLEPTITVHTLRLIAPDDKMAADLKMLLEASQPLSPDNSNEMWTVNPALDVAQIQTQLAQLQDACQQPGGVPLAELQTTLTRLQDEIAQVAAELRQEGTLELATKTDGATGDVPAASAPLPTNPPVIPLERAITTLFDQVTRHLQAEVADELNAQTRQLEQEKKAITQAQKEALTAAEAQWVAKQKAHEAELEQAKKQLCDVQAQLSTVEKTACAARNACNEMKQQLAQLTAAAEATDPAEQQIQSQVQATQTQLNALKVQLVKLTPGSEINQGKAALLNQQMAAQQKKLQDLHTQLRTFTQAREQKAEEAAHFQTSKVEPLHQQLAQAEQAVVDTKAQVAACQQALEDKTEALTDERKAHQTQQEQLGADYEQQTKARQAEATAQSDKLTQHITVIEARLSALRKAQAKFAPAHSSPAATDEVRQHLLSVRQQAIETPIQQASDALQTLTKALIEPPTRLLAQQWTVIAPPDRVSEYYLPLWLIRERSETQWQLFLAGEAVRHPTTQVDDDTVEALQDTPIYRYLVKALPKDGVPQDLPEQRELNSAQTTRANAAA